MSRALPTAHSIDRGEGLRLDIALLETESLLLHEEIIPEALEVLIQQIEGDGVLKAPVIVDRETLVVLDGMHRVQALRVLDCRFTCACLVDYLSPEIKVERWCRTISKPFDAGEAAKITRELGLDLICHSPRRTPEASEVDSSLLFRDAGYDLAASAPGPLYAFGAVRDLELRLRSMGFEVGYESERVAKEKLARAGVAAVICPPKVGKEEVVDIAMRGRVFTFKATRHIVPARPVGTDVPLSLLRDNSLTVEEANERLSELLSQKRLRHEPPGVIWDGRRYDEDLYLFEDI